MKEYIERDAAIHAIECRITKLMKEPEFRKKHVDIDLYGAKQNILNIPAADVVEVKLLDDGTLIVTTDKYPNVTRVFVEDGKTSGSLFYAEEE